MTLNSKDGWYGFDLDGTLAVALRGGLHSIGEPIPRMVNLLKTYLEQGFEVKIVTGRAAPPFLNPDGTVSTETQMIKEVEDWCEKNIGVRLPVTCSKDFKMIILYDDRARQVKFNTGEIIE